MLRSSSTRAIVGMALHPLATQRARRPARTATRHRDGDDRFARPHVAAVRSAPWRSVSHDVRLQRHGVPCDQRDGSSRAPTRADAARAIRSQPRRPHDLRRPVSSRQAACCATIRAPARSATLDPGAAGPLRVAGHRRDRLRRLAAPARCRASPCHTRNLERGPARLASCSPRRGEGDPLAHPRLTVDGPRPSGPRTTASARASSPATRRRSSTPTSPISPSGAWRCGARTSTAASPGRRT